GRNRLTQSLQDASADHAQHSPCRALGRWIRPMICDIQIPAVRSGCHACLMSGSSVRRECQAVQTSVNWDRRVEATMIGSSIGTSWAGMGGLMAWIVLGAITAREGPTMGTGAHECLCPPLLDQVALSVEDSAMPGDHAPSTVATALQGLDARNPM